MGRERKAQRGRQRMDIRCVQMDFRTPGRMDKKERFTGFNQFKI